MAILLSGLVGFCSERVRESEPGKPPEIFDLPAGRTIAAIIGAGLLGTSGEAGLLHFRGAFHNPFMVLPVTLPPLGAALLTSAAARGPGQRHRFTRWWMRLLAVMGFAGVGFHAYGVSRNMGGWRNWSQNVLNGPPLPAPPSFAGLALAGLAALGLMRDHPMRDRREVRGGESRYPGYDVLAKRPGPSWNEQTRRVVTQRLAIGPEPQFFSTEEFRTVAAIAARIVPQPAARPPISVAALVDRRLARGASDGYRVAGMPRDGDAWRLGLQALNS